MLELSEVTFKDFKKLNIRIGTVVEVKRVPGSDKLYIMKVDIEDEIRQIVTGLVDYYSEEELMGKVIDTGPVLVFRHFKHECERCRDVLNP